MIDTILLVPADGDPHGLLADGVCGSRPPIMVSSCGGTWTSEEDCPNGYDTMALVLAHQGKPVPEGCDRISRALRQRLRHAYTRDYASELAAAYARRHGGRVVLLDLDGREVTP